MSVTVTGVLEGFFLFSSCAGGSHRFVLLLPIPSDIQLVVFFPPSRKLLKF
jgi:hypothetical protein